MVCENLGLVVVAGYEVLAKLGVPASLGERMLQLGCRFDVSLPGMFECDSLIFAGRSRLHAPKPEIDEDLPEVMRTEEQLRQLD